MPLSDPILIFTILISIILIAPLLAERYRIPDLVLLLLAGTALGPHGFGVFARNSGIGLFSSVGLLYIMFLAGLEIDLHRFSRTRSKIIVFGLMTFCIPQVIGTLLGYYVLSFSFLSSMLLASMFASHTLLAYPLASRLGIARREPVSVTVGATVITDTLALLVLAVVADSAKGAEINTWFWLSIGLGLAGLFLLAWIGIPWLSRWFFNRVPEKGGAQFLFVIATVCGCSYLSHYAKMEPIIGAFLAGAAFNRLIPEHSSLMNRVEFVGNNIFIPFFLISVGMLVDPTALINDPNSWFVAVTMVFGVIVTKWLAARFAQALFGYQPEEGKVMFGLSVVQAAATLAAVLVGYELEIFDESVLNGAIAMIIVTAPLGSWVVDRYGRKMAAKATERPVRQSQEQRLLVSVARPESAPRLLDLAFLLRNVTVPGSIHPVTIVSDEDETTEAVAAAEQLLAQCLTHAASADMEVTPSVRVSMNISDGIIRTAKELRAETVLIGWGDGRTFSSKIFGTILENILEQCQSKVMLCRLVKPLNTTKRVLLLIHPMFDRRGDMSLLLRDVKFLVKQIGAELMVLVSDPALEESISSTLNRLSPSMSVSIVVSKDWVAARSRLFDIAAADDMIVLPLERRQSALWSPSMDRLSEAAASRFPDMNLLAVYPAIYSEEMLSLLQTEGKESGIEISARSDLDNAKSVDEALGQMVGSMRRWTAHQHHSSYSLLAESAKAYPIEMIPGIILIHAHSNDVQTTTILIGSTAKQWTLPNCRSPISVIIALVSPRDQSPEQHLKTLSSLARCLYDSPVSKGAGLSATAAEEIAAAMQRCFSD
jgi:Kef-type K+ transport system membrane component KefB/mannitol/fructose-specific phosphotransferase system IIA component (Ntr-type)